MIITTKINQNNVYQKFKIYKNIIYYNINTPTKYLELNLFNNYVIECIYFFNILKSIAYCNYSYLKNNLNGPAYIQYFKNGSICEVLYYVNGNLHRKNGPAHIQYDYKQSIIHEEYHIYGMLHNEHGPAIIKYYKNQTYKEYFLNGKMFTYKHYTNLQNNKNIS